MAVHAKLLAALANQVRRPAELPIQVPRLMSPKIQDINTTVFEGVINETNPTDLRSKTGSTRGGRKPRAKRKD
jgi:hypothetical protein